MTDVLFKFLPIDGLKILWVLFLSFLIGLQREERRHSGQLTFGGVRTYPLIGLVGYCLAFLSPQQPTLFPIGLGVIGGLMGLSYWHKMRRSDDVGVTSEIVGLATYIVGAVVYYGHYWLASTIVIISLFLLELKTFLEGLAKRFSGRDIFVFTQFLLLTIVILPILPNQDYGPFRINPFHTWLIVVAVSSISYASFLLQRRYRHQGSLLLVACLGGAYSSTVTTVALAKQSARQPQQRGYSGAILIASGMMYLRLALLIYLFNQALGERLSLPFLGLAGFATIVGGIGIARSRQSSQSETTDNPTQLNKNPLELHTAFIFAALFIGIIMITHYTTLYLGQQGIYVLSTIMGLTDVDPFILGMTQSGGGSIGLSTAATAITIAAASNNLAKGAYALSFADRRTGRRSCYLLIGLAVLGLLPIILLPKN
jgi:uncharacterized membrane protein (DUF4010 family)